MEKSILFLGEYDINKFSRARVLYKGLKKAGFHVDYCGDNTKRKYLILAKRLLKCDFKLLIVTSGIGIVLLCKLLQFIHRKPIILDELISVYDSSVFDRKVVKQHSLKARLLWFEDWLKCRLSNHIMVDTLEHADYFVRTFHIRVDKISVILVGADNTIFKPSPIKNHKGFKVLFYGSFLPIHGVDIILNAAHILRNKPIKFFVMGRGRSIITFNNALELSKKLELRNVYFDKKFLSSTIKIRNWIRSADICLGVFGATLKANRVIPYKVYETLAMAKPLITSNTQAIRTIGLMHKQQCYLIRGGNPEELARAIMILYNNRRFRNRLGKNGYEWFIEHASIEKIALSFTTQLCAKGIEI